MTNFSWSPITEAAELVLLTAARETAFRSGAMTSRIAQLTVSLCHDGHGINGTTEPDGRLRAMASTLPGRLLGVDAGGSGTRVVVLEGGQVTAQPDGPPMNALLTAGVADHLQRIIGAAAPTAAGIGLPGVRRADQARELG